MSGEADSAYEQEVEKAVEADLSEVENRGIVTVIREDDGSLIKDNEDNAIIMLIPALVPRGDDVWEKCFKLFIRESKDICGSGYRVLFIHSAFSSPVWMAWWLIRMRKRVSRAHKKNLKALTIVHPSLSVRVICTALGTVLRETFWRKLHYVDRIEELWLDEVLSRETATRVIPAGVAVFEEALVEETELLRDEAIALGVPLERRQQ